MSNDENEPTPIEEASLEQLVETIGPRVHTDVKPDGSNTNEVLTNLAILSEIHKRGKEKEAAQMALDKWPETKEDLNEEAEEWLELDK